MTEPSGAVPAVEKAVPAAGGPAVATPSTREPAPEPAAEPATTPAAGAGRPPVVQSGTGILLVLGIAWLGTRLWSADANIQDATNGLSRLIVAAYQLPDVIAASTLAGAGCGIAAIAWLTRRRPDDARTARWLTGGFAGLAIGVIVGGVVVIGYGHHSPDLILALSVTVACTLGGALAAFPPLQIMAAGVAATLSAFVVGVALNVYSSRIADLFGSATSPQSQFTAADRAALVESLVGGLAAGAVAFWHLRRRAGDRHFLAYLGAGATPGILILIAEVVTRVGGAQLFTLARKISPADNTVVDYLGSTRINHALIVLFTGMIVALIAFGRTLPRKQRPPH